MKGDYGDINVEDQFTGDPIDDWLKLKEREDISRETMRNYRIRFEWNSEGTSLKQFLDKQEVDVLDAGIDEFFEYRDFLRERGAAGRVLHDRFADFSSFYYELMAFNQTDSNPAGYVLNRSDFDTSSPSRDHHTVEEIGGYLRSISDPSMQTFALFLLKYGGRRGLGINTDLRCVNIDDDRYREDVLDQYGIELHEHVKNRPDSIYFYPEFNGGDVIAGEERQVGNKRTNPAVVPIDDELKQALLQHLTIRPRTGPPHPLFTQLKPIGDCYGRIKPSTVYGHLIRTHAVEYGLAEKGNNRSDVDLHYFRHFFGTQMRKHRGDHDGYLDYDLIKYIRGDLMGDDSAVEISHDKVLEIYTHDEWGVKIREPYVNNIYQFDLFD